MINVLAFSILGYLLGSIPFGIFLGKISKGLDIRDYGSGNTGMTNVLRTVGLKSAFIVLILDMSKSILAILITRLVTNSPELEVMAGLTSIIGHNWPIFAGFKGRKGGASAVGIPAVLNPLSALAAILTFLPILFTTKYVSLGSIFGAIVAMIILIVQSISEINDYSYIYALAVGPLLVIKHHENIRRLINGNERKFGEKE